MLNDLKLFLPTNGLKVFNRGKNRAIVFVDQTTDIEKIVLLSNTYPMITLVSQNMIKLDFENAVSKQSIKIEYKEVPKDKMVYEALGKGLKEYEYYIKSFMFTSVL